MHFFNAEFLIYCLIKFVLQPIDDLLPVPYTIAMFITLVVV